MPYCFAYVGYIQAMTNMKEHCMTRKIHIEAGQIAGDIADALDSMGYRYGYSGRPCQRKAPSNMPYITIDVDKGFYSGSKGAETSVHWKKVTRYTVRELFRQLPDIHDIQEKAAYDPRPTHQHMLVESKDGRKMERVWYTATGRAIGISRMDDDHLHNTILLVDRNIANGETIIGNNKDLAHLLNELEDERIHRGLHLPLVPLISLEYRKGIHNV